MDLISTIFGLVAVALGLVGLFPLLGWLTWLSLFLSFFGMIFGLSDRSRTTGITINFLVMVLAIIRLLVGGGIV